MNANPKLLDQAFQVILTTMVQTGRSPDSQHACVDSKHRAR